MSEITGTVQKVFERVDRATANGSFSSRDIVIRTNDQYPQDISIQFTQDRCDLLDLYKLGEEVTIAYNLRGRLNGWTNPQGEVKYFNTVQGWSIKRTGNQTAAPSAAQTTPAPAATAPQKKYVHIDAQYTEAQYLASPGWNHEVMVQQGKGRWETAAPVAPAAGPANPPAQVALGDDGVPF